MRVSSKLLLQISGANSFSLLRENLNEFQSHAKESHGENLKIVPDEVPVTCKIHSASVTIIFEDAEVECMAKRNSWGIYK